MNPDRIELIVDEPIRGHFYWMLIKQESIGAEPKTVDCAAGPMPSYSSAMMAGISALQRRSEGHAHDGRSPVISAFAAIQGYPGDAAQRH